MNTVDALKDLYKTLCGKDYAGDPNPTDAEMIDAIAKDAQSGGGSGGARIIDLTTLEPRQEVDPEDDEDIINYFSGYEAGLSASDFINAWLKTAGGMLVPILKIRQVMNDSIFSLEVDKSISVLNYIPETGEFSYVQQGGEGGGGGK